MTITMATSTTSIPTGPSSEGPTGGSGAGSDLLTRVLSISDYLDENAHRGEELMRLPDDVAQRVRDTGVIRCLQPKDFGGYESHPSDFFRAVFNIGIHDGAAGWVAGVVGVHNHELAQGNRRAQEELWGDDPDTWIASPYAPMGRALPVEGGWILNGRWPFSSGTDHCSWVTIGGMEADANGKVTNPEAIHFLLPRPDYEIVHDSWNVYGLRGTGSKDLIVKDAFVPHHRAIRTDPVTDGTAGVAAGRDSTLYRMPRNIIFSGAITAATLALAYGTLTKYVEWTRGRVSRYGAARQDPYQLEALGAASADIDASLVQFFHDMDRAYDIVDSGRLLSLDERAQIRRNQVRSSQRSVGAADWVFRVSGGSQLQMSHPMQRFWRDAQAALHHVQNLQGKNMEAYGLNLFGEPIPAGVKI